MPYNVNEWQTGDYVTAEKLNNVESGISELDTNKEDLNNKVLEINAACTDDQYPSAKAVWNLISKVPGFDPGGGGGDSEMLVKLIDRTLESIENDEVEKIGYHAFQSCSSLTSVNFPMCSYIGGDAFGGCSSLTSVNFPMCSYIGGNAFYRCSSLTSISFPMCSYIDGGAFGRCYRLTKLNIAFSAVCSLLYSNAFTSTPIAGYTEYTSGQIGSIYVPASLVDAYKSAANWSYFSDRITAIEGS